MRRVLSSMLVISMACAGCGDDEEVPGETSPDDFETLDASVCAADHGPFSLSLDNPYLPLPVGLVAVLEGEEDGVELEVQITVLDETELVAGVITRVVEESEREDGALVEVSRNFFAQADDGTVCYFGEDVDDYAGGEIVGHGGAWRAGVDGAVPGILMPGTPVVGTKFAQENAPGVAEDMSAIVAKGETIDLPAGSFTDTVHAVDWNPLEGETGEDGEDKVYASGVGLIVDADIELTSVTGL